MSELFHLHDRSFPSLSAVLAQPRCRRFDSCPPEPVGPGRPGHGVIGGHARCSRSQVTASVWGRTRVPATAVMKLVSPTQRGTACRWRWRGIPAPAACPRLAPRLIPSGPKADCSAETPRRRADQSSVPLLVGQLVERPDMTEGQDHQVAAGVGVGVEHGEGGRPHPQHPVVGRRRPTGGDPAEHAPIGPSGTRVVGGTRSRPR